MTALPQQVRDWIGTTVFAEDDVGPVEPGMIAAFAAAAEDANLIYWDEAEAGRTTGGRIAPPASLSTWSRPLSWSPDGARRNPLALHFALKERLGLPKAIVSDTEIEFHAPVRVGDRVRSEQILESVSEPVDSRLGPGRAWVIAIRYSRPDGTCLGIERLHFFAYGA